MGDFYDDIVCIDSSDFSASSSNSIMTTTKTKTTTTENISITANGYIEISNKSNKKDFKPFYIILIGSTIFYYNKETDKNHQGVIQLNGCQLELSANVITIRATSGKAVFCKASGGLLLFLCFFFFFYQFLDNLS
jgi:hypothetical protein